MIEPKEWHVDIRAADECNFMLLATVLGVIGDHSGIITYKFNDEARQRYLAFER